MFLFAYIIVERGDFMFEYLKTLSPKEAKRKLDENPNIILLDVREPDEYEQSHLPNSKLIPLDVLENDILNQIDKDQTLFVYCHSGRRSKAACMILKDLGYENVYDIGGIISWPYEII